MQSLDVILADESALALRLEPLSREEGMRLAVDLAPGLDAERANAVWERAQGSPFWIAAFAPRLDTDLAKVVNARVHGVGKDATMLFSVLCVVGRPLGIAELGVLLLWSSRLRRWTNGGAFDCHFLARRFKLRGDRARYGGTSSGYGDPVLPGMGTWKTWVLESGSVLQQTSRI